METGSEGAVSPRAPSKEMRVYPRPSRFAQKRLRPPIQTQDIQPAPVDLVRPQPEPEAKKQGLVHLGGPWYLVGDQKVRGKEAAVAKAREEGLL